MNWRPQAWLALVGLFASGKTVWANEPRLPEPIARLPADTPLAVFVPQMRTLLEELGALQDTLPILDPDFRRLDPTSLLSKILWGTHDQASEGYAAPAFDTGLNLNGPLVVRFLPRLSALILVLPVRDRLRFRGWLRRLHAPHQETSLAGHTVDLLARASDLPVACAVGKVRAVCQIGTVDSERSPPLVDHLKRETVRLDGVPGLAEAFQALPTDARWQAVLRPRLAAEAVTQAWRRHLRHAHRFHAAQARTEAEAEVLRWKRSVVHHARMVDAIAVGVQAKPTGGRVDLVIQLTEQGRQRVAGWLPARPPQLRLRRWASTPALVNLFVETTPATAAGMARMFNLDVPARSLNGSFAMLTLGVDTMCPAARSGAGQRMAWSSLFPSAVALGLKAEPQVSARAPHAPADLEFHVVEDVLLAGTGPMGGYAARRRLRTAAGISLQDSNSFLYAAVDLGAFNEAFKAGLVTQKHRFELRWIDQTRRRLWPLFHRLNHLRVSGAREAAGKRLRLQLALTR